MSFAAKWKFQASESESQVAIPIANIANIATIPPQTNSGDSGDSGDRVPSPEIAKAGGPSGLPWPEPEPSPLVVRSDPWKYALLFAIATHFGAVLNKESENVFALTSPATMPQEAAQAARDGLAELVGYIRGRLQ